jgi:hypothetical protein
MFLFSSPNKYSRAGEIKNKQGGIKNQEVTPHIQHTVFAGYNGLALLILVA